jgi:elongation factor 1-alpha
MADKKHLSIVICGHVDAGKSTTTGRLLFELGNMDARELEVLKAEAEAQGKKSFAFAFFMDKSKEERERGVTISCTTKEFFTDNFHYTIIDAPGHRDFIKNMITGASQADVALLMIPADSNFESAIQEGDPAAGQIQGQTRQHARLLKLLGIQQIIVGVNKMDEKTVAKYSIERYLEIRNNMMDMLADLDILKKHKKDVRKKMKKEGKDEKLHYKNWNSIPMIPISGWMGDNIIEYSNNMKWWEGWQVRDDCLVKTLLDALNNMVTVPERDLSKPLRMPVSQVCKIRGVGDVVTGRVEQGVVKKNDVVEFIPTSTSSKPCFGKVFSVEVHHKPHEQAIPGDNVGINVKSLDKDHLPKSGDIMKIKGDDTIQICDTFVANCQIIDHPGQLKVGYTPIAFVRTARSAVRMTKILKKLPPKTKHWEESPNYIKAKDKAVCEFCPAQPFVVDEFKKCEGLGRVAIFEGNTVVMLGQVAKVNFRA